MTPSMNRFPIESASFVSVGYSAEQSLLEVEFRDGAVYRFFDVPASCFQQLLTSDSRGRYFNSSIRNRFRNQRVSTINIVLTKKTK